MQQLSPTDRVECHRRSSLLRVVVRLHRVPLEHPCEPEDVPKWDMVLTKWDMVVTKWDMAVLKWDMVVTKWDMVVPEAPSPPRSAVRRRHHVPLEHRFKPESVTKWDTAVPKWDTAVPKWDMAVTKWDMAVTKWDMAPSNGAAPGPHLRR